MAGPPVQILAFPAEHWAHLRTTNPIESTFATVRHRTRWTKNCVTRSTFLGLAFKMAEEAAKTWRRIRAPEQAAALLAGARYEDGVPVPAAAGFHPATQPAFLTMLALAAIATPRQRLH